MFPPCKEGNGVEVEPSLMVKNDGMIFRKTSFWLKGDGGIQERF